MSSLPQNTNHQKIHEKLTKSFKSRGMAFLGCVNINLELDYGRFSTWLDAGNHATMDFLERNRELRRNADGLLPNTKSAVVFGLPYCVASSASSKDALNTSTVANRSPRVAKYARISDYHRVMWRDGEAAFRDALLDTPFHEQLDPTNFRVCVDSAPILERALAAQTGAGFIGKNTCFIAGREGSFLLLGVILTQLEIPLTPVNNLPKSRKNSNDCGGCKRCQVHCPTGALDQQFTLDSRKCLSYWTIEHRGTIPEQFWPWLGRYWYGCDICQDVCPYNRTARPLERPDLIRSVNNLRLVDIATMDQKFYEENFGGTAMTRAKRNGLRRNAMIAMTVSGDPELLTALLHAKSDTDTIIRQTAKQIEQYLGTTA